MAQHVCAALEQQSPAYLLYVSSDAVYSDSESLLRETSPCDPSSFHGLMHTVREKMLLEVCTRKQIPLLLARPCAVYGAGDTHNSYGPNRFISSLRSKGTIALGGEGEEQRDHLYIEDLSQLLLACLERQYRGALNLATGKAHSFHEVATLVERALGKANSIQFQARTAAITHKHFDCTRLAQAFPGFQFTSLEEGIKKSVS
jgi:nucleoside-diphosphate-sugar epimerase